MKEPSVLDYLKSRLNPWQKEKIRLPQSEEPASPDAETPGPGSTSPIIPAEISPGQAGLDEASLAPNLIDYVPWRTLLALFIAILAQRTLEPPAQSIPLSAGLYIFALLILAWAYFDSEFSLPVTQAVLQPQTDPQTYHRNSLLVAMFLAVLAFLLFSDDLFTTVNVTLWLAAIFLFLRSLWLGLPDIPAWVARLVDFFKRESWKFSISRWTILLVLVSVIIIFFRFYNLNGVPGEPFSDHAEKLLDVSDLLNGKTLIFFPRNTGREFIQFYLSAVLATVLGTGITFITLKIGTALIGLVSLPYIYLIGKEIGGKRVALFALVLAGTSYWLNTISRIGLRFPLYPAFAAPALYYLIRGLRRQTRNDFILSGLFLGFGLHGYSPYRLVPFVILAGVGIYLLHRQSHGTRQQTLMMFSILVLTAFLVFLPLMRYAIDQPEMFSLRAMTRLTGEEHPLDAPAWQILARNTYNAMLMFNYDDGEIWVHSIPHRPALDIISAVLFVFGYIFLFIRYLRKRNWLDLFLFLSVPLLLLPSTLSLAFPNENPSLNRTGGAAVIVFVVAALALEGIYTSMHSARRARGVAVTLVVGLLAVSALQNYNLVFDKFSTEFMQGAWNTSDMGNVIRSFVSAGNSPDNAFVVPYPYWVDTRLVGIQAGYPTKDYAISREQLPSTLSVTGNKLFMVKEEDRQTLDDLAQLYPSGILGHFTSRLEGKNFWIFTVPENLKINP